MQRVTVTLDDDLMAELDAIIAERGYQNRSEAIRDLARAGIKEAAPDSGRGRDCVAALVYVYDHEARQLSKRLVRAYHDQHELSLASLHVHRQPWPHTMARCQTIASVSAALPHWRPSDYFSSCKRISCGGLGPKRQ